MTLDALLKEVEALYAKATNGPIPDLRVPVYVAKDAIWQDDGDAIWSHGENPERVYFDAADYIALCINKAPLLARMLREAVGALYAGANLVNGPAECHAALSRLDAMAGEVGA